MSEVEKTEPAIPSSWAMWLKVAAVIATVIGGAIGSYKAARSDSKAETQAGYATMKEAIEHLEQTQKMMWDVLMKTPAPTSSLPSSSLPSSSLPEHARPSLTPIEMRMPMLRPLPKNMDEVMTLQTK